MIPLLNDEHSLLKSKNQETCPTKVRLSIDLEGQYSKRRLNGVSCIDDFTQISKDLFDEYSALPFPLLLEKKQEFTSKLFTFQEKVVGSLVKENTTQSQREEVMRPFEERRKNIVKNFNTYLNKAQEAFFEEYIRKAPNTTLEDYINSCKFSISSKTQEKVVKNFCEYICLSENLRR